MCGHAWGVGSGSGGECTEWICACVSVRMRGRRGGGGGRGQLVESVLSFHLWGSNSVITLGQQALLLTKSLCQP